MSIDWTLVARYVAPILALFVGAALNHYLERRPRLLSYIAHASAVAVKPPDGPEFNVHTHSVVVKNAGKKPAVNVRLGHFYLPNFSVYPSVSYEQKLLPSGGSELVFPTLVPGEQITVAYLYYPPVLWSGVNSYTKSDEGLAKILSVLPTPQGSPWLVRASRVLIVVGALALIYLAIVVAR